MGDDVQWRRYVAPRLVLAALVDDGERGDREAVSIGIMLTQGTRR